jgi:hypothetical protein
MRALLRESQRLAIFRHSADPGTDGRARFCLGAVDSQRIDPRYGHHIEIRVSAHRVGFAILLEGQRRRGFLPVRRRRFYCQRYTLRRFSVNARLALRRRAGRERRFREIQFPRPDYRVRGKRRACPDRKDGSDEQSFDYGLHLSPQGKWICNAPPGEVAFLLRRERRTSENARLMRGTQSDVTREALSAPHFC